MTKSQENAQREAIAAHPDQPLHIEDSQTRESYLLLKAGKFPELEEEYVRARLEEGTRGH